MSAHKFDVQQGITDWYRAVAEGMAKAGGADMAPPATMAARERFATALMAAVAELATQEELPETAMALAERMIAGMGGYVLATGHDGMCVNCIATRAQAYTNALVAGLRAALAERQDARPLS